MAEMDVKIQTPEGEIIGTLPMPALTAISPSSCFIFLHASAVTADHRGANLPF